MLSRNRIRKNYPIRKRVRNYAIRNGYTSCGISEQAFVNRCADGLYRRLRLSATQATLTATRARSQAIKASVRNIKLNYGWAAIYLFYQAQLFPDYKT